MDAVSSLEKIVIKESIDFEVACEESKDAIVDPIIEIYVEESNHVKESYAKAIQYMDIYFWRFS